MARVTVPAPASRGRLMCIAVVTTTAMLHGCGSSEVRGQGLFDGAGRLVPRPAGGRASGSCTPHRHLWHHWPPLVSPVPSPGPVPGRCRAGPTTTMEHCRGHHHHDAPSSWSAGLPGRRRNAIRCITGTTRPATPMLTPEEPRRCDSSLPLVRRVLPGRYLVSRSSPGPQALRAGRCRGGLPSARCEAVRCYAGHLHIVPVGRGASAAGNRAATRFRAACDSGSWARARRRPRRRESCRGA
jgi:hypothetical protein